jgi:hypothetical protein
MPSPRTLATSRSPTASLSTPRANRANREAFTSRVAATRSVRRGSLARARSQPRVRPELEQRLPSSISSVRRITSHPRVSLESEWMHVSTG